MTYSACPSTRLITAVTRSRTARCAGSRTRAIRPSDSPSPPRTASTTLRRTSCRRSRSTSAVRSVAVDELGDLAPRGGACSHGTAVNCSWWVTSCRQTQSRKSAGSTPSFRSVATMLGATSSSRPPVPKISYWPSTREERKASSPPAWTPVAREPMAVASGAGAAVLLLGQRLDQRVEQRGHAAGVGVDPAGPVDDGDLGHRSAGGGRRPVSASTCATATAAASCSSRTTAAASSRVVAGPGAHQPAGGASGEVPVDHRGGAAHRLTVRGGAVARRSAAAAAGQRGGDVVERGLGRRLAARSRRRRRRRRAAGRRRSAPCRRGRARRGACRSWRARCPGRSSASPRSRSVPS